MKNRFIAVLILLIILSLEISYAQNPSPNNKVQRLMKYWLYRKRLEQDFLTGIAGELGHNIPSHERTLNDHTIDFSDQIIYYSYYISVLATEYKLLSNWNQPTNKVVAELYYALKSFNDLDGFSESFFDSQWGFTLNGFFTRDDVAMDYYTGSTPNANYVDAINRLNQNNFGSLAVNSFGNTSGGSGSGWVDYVIFAHHSGSYFEESKDQVVALLLGLRIVQKCSDNLYYQNNDIKQMAKDIGNRVVNWIHTPNVTPNALHWKIKNPVTGIQVHAGYDAAGWAYGISKTYKALTGNNNPTTAATFDASWQVLKRDFKWGAHNYYIAFGLIPDEGWKMLSLLCSSGCCETNWAKIDYNSRSNLIPKMRFWHFPLIWHFLNGGFLATSQSDYEDLLDDAPCFGPYNYGNGNYLHGNFSSPSKFYRQDIEGDDIGGNTGDYNGLDYMLLYNMFLLAYYGNGDADYINLYNTEVYQDLPFSSSNAIGVGIIGDAAYITSHKTIDAYSTINSNGNVTFRAGESINLNNGFQIVPGADFSAIIDDFICNQDGDQYLRVMQQTDNSEINSSININTPQNNLVAYPQPCITKCFLDFVSVAPDTYNLEILNELGSNITSVFSNRHFDKGKYTIEVACSSLPTGIYLAKLSSKTTSLSKKIIVSN